MAVLHKDPNASKERKSFYQECLDTSKLTAIKPDASSITIFRPIPEIGPDGNIMPMIKSMTPAGPDFSNIAIEEVVVNTGVSTKFTGLCRASDSDTTEAINMVFPSMYIKLKSKEKRGELPAEIADKIKKLLEETANPKNPKIKTRLLQRTQSIGFMQGIALTVNGKPLDKPAVRQALVLPSSLCTNLANMLQLAHKEGKDVFDPKSGYAVIIKGLPPDPSIGRQVTIFTAELGKQMPIPETKAKEFWVPWDTAFKRYTTDQLIMAAIRCYGSDVVSVIFPDDVARLAVQVKPTQPVVQTQKPAQAPTPPVHHTGPEELDLSSAVSGPVDDGSADEAPDIPPAKGVSPPSAEDLASKYQEMLKNM